MAWEPLTRCRDGGRADGRRERWNRPRREFFWRPSQAATARRPKPWSNGPTARCSPCCASFSGNPDLAADLTQETYRRAWAALASFDGRAQFSTWLYRIATNAFLNHVRRPHAVVPLDEQHSSTLPDGSLPQDEEAIAGQTGERLRRAVLGLPEELRFTVAARYWGEAAVAEIARAEGISEVAIRKRLKRAYRLLAIVLEEVEP